MKKIKNDGSVSEQRVQRIVMQPQARRGKGWMYCSRFIEYPGLAEMEHDGMGLHTILEISPHYF